mgnify:CR=1 FL=1
MNKKKTIFGAKKKIFFLNIISFFVCNSHMSTSNKRSFNMDECSREKRLRLSPLVPTVPRGGTNLIQQSSSSSKEKLCLDAGDQIFSEQTTLVY